LFYRAFDNSILGEPCPFFQRVSTNFSIPPLFMLVSSNVVSPRPTDYLISTGHPDFKQTGLRQSSVVKVDKIVSLLQAIAQRHLGVLSRDMQSSIDKILISILGLNLVPK
jgi:hypothetical protein